MPSNSVIDLSHHNGTKLRFDKAKADGIVGVIQKATQGESYVDATFKKNKAAALDAGLLFGAYHFGTGSNGVSQAEHFLETVAPDEDTVVVLDFEDKSNRKQHDAGGGACVRHSCPRQTRAVAWLLQWPHDQAGVGNRYRPCPEELLVLACTVRPDAGRAAVLEQLDHVAIH
jgi:Glycosyl hydrolases family 25